MKGTFTPRTKSLLPDRLMVATGLTTSLTLAGAFRRATGVTPWQYRQRIVEAGVEGLDEAGRLAAANGKIMVENDTRTPEHRVVALAGARNLRDLGGYPAAGGGHVRWGLLFRSGSLSGLSQTEWDTLRGRGIRTICDLRTETERAAEPFAWADQAGLNYWARDYQLSFAVLGETLRSGFPTGEAARAGMIAGYAELPWQQAPAYRQLFAHLRTGDLPLIFNCAAGKDRAGTAAALILTALGVPRDVVIEDYMLTNQVYDVGAMLRRPRAGHLDRFGDDVGAAVARADPAYIAAALDAIDMRCGGIEGYLAEYTGMSSADIVDIRARLIA